jgi:hypothetical protein
MAAIAVAGVGLMVVCSSSLAAVMMMGGEEDTPTTTTPAGPSAPAPVLPEARYVRVERPSANYPGNIINLGELQVFDKAGTNIALNTTVTGGPGNHPAGPWPNLTDGNFGSFAHTSSNGESFIEVDLGAVKEIAKVVITNRSDCCQDRLGGAKIELLDGSRANVTTTPAIESSKMKLTYDFDVATPAWEYADA